MDEFDQQFPQLQAEEGHEPEVKEPETEPEVEPEAPVEEPEAEEKESGLIPVMVSSHQQETITVNGKKHVYGSINGVPYQVECDSQQMVTPEVASALSGLLEYQKSK